MVALARRFAGNPLEPPSYNFSLVPYASKELSGSKISYSENRDDYTDAMAEFVLLCNEVQRRRRQKKSSGIFKSKPLTLEYIADRLDVDDPLQGFLVRRDSELRELQGLITITTFTNWQASFRWDSLHDSAFAYDSNELRSEMTSGKRIWDFDGSLACELNGLVKCGDAYGEGVVFPRIAEIALLGGLGCGKLLLEMALHFLENEIQSTPNKNYDFVVLQASENSVSFYERMGFIRVGAITEDQKKQKQQDDQQKSSEPDQCQSDLNKDEKHDDKIEASKIAPTALAPAIKSEIVTSPIINYKIQKPYKESPKYLAAKFNVNLDDILFLNEKLYPEIQKHSKFKNNTVIRMPSSPIDDKSKQNCHLSEIQWYVAKENDTPSKIARKYKISPKELVQGNTHRLEGLKQNSRLKRGTKVQLSGFGIPEEKYVPYCHWTFPEDGFEHSEPSYMMVKKLNRGNKKNTDRPDNITITPYMRPKRSTPKSDIKPQIPTPPKKPISALERYKRSQKDCIELSTMSKAEMSKFLSQKWKLLPGLEKAIHAERASNDMKIYNASLEQFQKDNPDWSPPCRKKIEEKESLTDTTKLHSNEPPMPPKKPISAKEIYKTECNTKLLTISHTKLSRTERLKQFSEQWKVMPGSEKMPYEERSKKLHQQYKEDLIHFNASLDQFRKDNPDWNPEKQTRKKAPNLFNKVVRLNSHGIKTFTCAQDSSYRYFYVLTYIPDLQWCRLGPLRSDGWFGNEDENKPKWKLIPENEGLELDVPAGCCLAVKGVKSMKRTSDADDEEWDILGSGDGLLDKKKIVNMKSLDIFKGGKYAQEEEKPTIQNAQPTLLTNGITTIHPPSMILLPHPNAKLIEDTALTLINKEEESVKENNSCFSPPTKRQKISQETTLTLTDLFNKHVSEKKD